MKPGQVIGNVALSHAVPQFRGARWLIVAPMGPEQLRSPEEAPPSKTPTPVVYDNLGAGTGDAILYVEGTEATQPFQQPTPVDALNVAILDRISFE
ncbi:MAG: EutN/CcmL family microcompartment protein [Opitutales bacterium]